MSKNATRKRVHRLKTRLKNSVRGDRRATRGLARLWVLADVLNLESVRDRAGKSRPTAPE